ncbi:MAG: transposase [Streptococcaceae bacterium]|jgi:esterase/lipase superfamily enzyme|nr:transposase [Streptococcaceae bacterium]
MHFESRSHYSGSLGREMYFNVYGHAGKPIIVFPSSGGSHNEYADFGMIEACQSWIDRGLVRFYTPQSIDSESWLADGKSGHDMSKAHNAYDSYIIHELVQLIRHENPEYPHGLGLTGCSMGAFHTINFALKHPDIFDTSVALSGVYDARFFTGDFYSDDVIYYNSPLDFLSNMNDNWFINQYKSNRFIISVGQGSWEAPHIADTRRLQLVFGYKGIPGWFDYWGHDVPHDWSAWRRQMPHFLANLENDGWI